MSETKALFRFEEFAVVVRATMSQGAVHRTQKIFWVVTDKSGYSTHGFELRIDCLLYQSINLL